MKEYPIFELREVLNYDTYRQQVFSFYERLCLHKAISDALSYCRECELEGELAIKVTKLLAYIKQNNIRPVKKVVSMNFQTNKIEIT